jgi:hypothetical protein
MMEQLEWITVTEAAEIAGYNEAHLRRILRTGEIEGRKFATVWQVNRGSLEAYMAKMAAKGKKRGPKQIDN